MDARLTVVLALALLGTPAAAHADAAWTCSAATGWVAANGQRADAPALSGNPCPAAEEATGGAGGLSADGALRVAGGEAGQTTDARRPQASVDARTVSIRSSDGKFALDASKLTAQAQGACDSNRKPAFTSAGGPGSVTLNGRPIDTSHEYSEPGVGVNGAPLFGKITIRFGEVTNSDTGIARTALHAIVTDRDGTVVFEAVAGVVAVGRDGPVCDPPPVCPAGTQPQAGRCVDVTVTPLPTPPASIPSPPRSSPPTPVAHQRGCRDVNARAGQASAARIAAATLCLMNTERKQRHLGKLHSNLALRGAAARYAHAMLAGHFFAHGDVLGRILHSGYLGRFGHWRIGENLGLGWGGGGTPRQIVRAWMRSPDHRRNILSRGFHDAGVAAVLGSPLKRRKGSITYVVDFGGFG